MNVNNLCLGCMNTLTNPRAACPHCGWSRRTSQNHLQQLPQGITLTNPLNARQYLIGKTVGQGGFGIVYTAWDVAGNRKVAVKEYFPKHFVTRDRSNTVVLTSDSQSNKEFFDKQKKRFRQEAEKMQLFADSPNVVTVRDFFDANNTSYIVMEFVEGQTLDQILNGPIAKNHRLSLQTVLLNLKQIVAILEQMHHTPWTDDNGKIHQGIIHRDISPENIMYASDGTVKLINFGAPRFTIHYTQELKPDCAPCEQYFSFGDAAKQGSWTDVYAFAATIYYAITGQFPANSLVRALDRDNTNVDPLVLPSAFGIQITPAQEQILLNGLALDYHNRYQSVSQFYNDLVNAGSYDNDEHGTTDTVANDNTAKPISNIPSPLPLEQTSDKSNLLPAIILSAVSCLMIVIFFSLMLLGNYVMDFNGDTDTFYVVCGAIVFSGISVVCLGVYTWELWRIRNGKQSKILTNATWQNAVIGLQTLISIATLLITVSGKQDEWDWFLLAYVACSLLGIWLGRKFLCKNS